MTILVVIAYTVAVAVIAEYNGLLRLHRTTHDRVQIIRHPPKEISTPANLKTGDILIPQHDILSRIDEMACDIAQNHKGEQPLAISVLNGAMFFGVILQQNLAQYGLEVHADTMRVSSYRGVRQVAQPRVSVEPKNSVNGRSVMVIEDIIDSATTMDAVLRYLINHGANSITSISLISKPSRRKVPFEADYTGFVTDDVWLEGFGLDTNEYGRTKLDIIKGCERAKIKTKQNPYLIASLACQAEMGLSRVIKSLRNISTMAQSGSIFSARK